MSEEVRIGAVLRDWLGSWHIHRAHLPGTSVPGFPLPSLRNWILAGLSLPFSQRPVLTRQRGKYRAIQIHHR
jgi:hypothetical protein